MGAWQGSASIAGYLPTATDGEVLDAIEAWFKATRQLTEQYFATSQQYVRPGEVASILEPLVVHFRETINEILDDHELAWHLSGSEMVPVSSTVMHVTITEPVLSLLGANARYAAVETSYRKALRELKPDGDPSDAITDAGRALQEMLVAAGAQGPDLGRLLVDARKRELLAPYDSKLAEAVGALTEWVSADRSQRGDTHLVRDANREDAWLAARVTGALILRLAAGPRR